MPVLAGIPAASAVPASVQPVPAVRGAAGSRWWAVPGIRGAGTGWVLRGAAPGGVEGREGAVLFFADAVVCDGEVADGAAAGQVVQFDGFADVADDGQFVRHG